jgi:hypothetical protein
MVKRRSLLSGGLIAGAGAVLVSEPAEAAQQDDRQQVADAISELRESIERGFRVSPELSRIREHQRIFLKANQKFPDFIEVGISVWESVYDWHVRHQQPLNMTRGSDGHYVMTVMMNTLVLRPDQSDTFIGFGFDER